MSNSSSLYSPQFADLLRTRGIRELLAGSCVRADDCTAEEALAAWESSRRLIATAIRASGTILDYGCANGFLLRSLQEWSRYEVVPYGVDIDHERLNEARMLFTGMSGHFYHPETPAQVPPTFDHVYWAVGDNIDFSEHCNREWLAAVERLVTPGGRLILGFYDTRARNETRVQELTEWGWHAGEVIRNDFPGEEIVCWVDV